MTGLVRKATFLSACGLLIAGTAMAFVPNPATSVYPCGIILVGQNGSNVPDPQGTFTVVIKDVAGNPVPNVALVFDFTACCNDIRPSVTQHGGGVTEANHKKVDITTDGVGSATITIEGMANKLSPNPATPGHGGCVNLFANGVKLTDLLNGGHLMNAAAPDIDGGAGGAGLGVHGSDFSSFLADLFPVPGSDYRQRSDLNHVADSCNDLVNGQDFARFLGFLFAPGGAETTNDVQDNASCP